MATGPEHEPEIEETLDDPDHLDDPDNPDDREQPPVIGTAPLAVSLLPFALLLALYFVFPAYGSLAFRGQPEIAGFKLAMLVLLFGLAWASLGVYLVSEAESFGEATAAFVTCTLPSSALVALAPLLQSPYF
jgi:hypothetical protein